MSPTYILVAVIVLVVVNYVNKHWRKWWYRNDINVPAPATKRTDLHYGYFGCLFDQVEETRDHVNLLMWMKYRAYGKQDAETFDRGRRDEYKAEFQAYCRDVSAEWERYKSKVHVVAYGGL